MCIIWYITQVASNREGRFYGIGGANAQASSIASAFGASGGGYGGGYPYPVNAFAAANAKAGSL